MQQQITAVAEITMLLPAGMLNQAMLMLAIVLIQEAVQEISLQQQEDVVQHPELVLQEPAEIIKVISP